ncbi:hypothetical protein Tco_1437658 [Tanacetum coccineum]
MLQCSKLESVHAVSCPGVVVQAVQTQELVSNDPAPLEDSYSRKRMAGGSKRVGIPFSFSQPVGVVAFDLQSASLYLSEYIETSCTSYQNTKTLLHFYDPNILILILPSSLPSDDALSHLVDSSVRKVTMLRAAFDDTRGALLIKSLAAKEPSALGLDSYYKQYYLCLATVAATVKWIKADKGVVIPKSFIIVY